MTTTSSRAAPSSRPAPPVPAGAAPGALGAMLARHLDRPLTSYYLLLGATGMLVALGLVMVFSASSVVSYRDTSSSFTIFQKQAQWVLTGLPLLWLAARLRPRSYRALAYPALVAATGLLCLVAVKGTEVNGNRNWLDFGGPFRIQPSEFAKLALVLYGADVLTRKRRLLTRWNHLLVPLLPVGMLVTGLVLLGGDLGTSIILMAIVASLLYVAGAPLRLFVGLAVLGGGLVTWLTATHGYRLKRISSWLDPAADPQGAGFQALHGRYALGSGGWFGSGLGASKEKWGRLPYAHTDFIFAIIGEELGLVGTLAVLVLFAAVGFAGFRVAVQSRDMFVRLAAAGVTSWVLVQALVNVGAVLGLLPITGVPLPLVSYGGSALLPTMIGLGMLLSFARRSPGARAALAARGPGLLRRLVTRRRRRRRR